LLSGGYVWWGRVVLCLEREREEQAKRDREVVRLRVSGGLSEN